jgi:hypothetical protein
MCPLLTAGYLAVGDGDVGQSGGPEAIPREPVDCAKAKCAWWDETWRSCVVHHMASKS